MALMLSVCVPVYNCPIGSLVSSLDARAHRLNAAVELVFIDDGSDARLVQSNREACQKHTYIALGENIGRARVRNMFLKHAHGEYLLYLDCDSLMASEDFLERYIAEIEKAAHPTVFCGGRVYPEEPPERGVRLRWKYGVRNESQTAEQRGLHPYRAFMTNNFAVHRSVMEDIGFDESLTDYGHEDTLFGFRLMQAKVPIVHIDNPVLNGHLETNAAFLIQTEQAVGNLARMAENLDGEPQFFESVKLLRYHRASTQWAAYGLLRAVYKTTAPLIKWALSSGWANLKLFGFLKWGLLGDELRDRPEAHPPPIGE